MLWMTDHEWQHIAATGTAATSGTGAITTGAASTASDMVDRIQCIFRLAAVR